MPFRKPRLVVPEVALDSNYLRWEMQSEEVVGEYSFFSVHRLLSNNESVQLRQPSAFYRIKFSSWVNVVPLTDDYQVVMVEQFRHGVQDLTLELPGGGVDSTDQSSQNAAARELREETGFASKKWSLLGVNHPNPAIQENVCYTHLAEDVVFEAEPTFDNTGTEILRTKLVPLGQVSSLIRQGVITHSLVLAAFHYLAINHAEAAKVMGLSA